jgi:glycerol-3-phosphate acyltransferase PlsY
MGKLMGKQMSQDVIIYLGLPLLGYLLGAIPFGLLIGLAKGIDIRKQGSGNIGATNVGRILGRKWGYICFVLDVAKGLVPVLWAGAFLRRTAEMTTSDGTLSQLGQLAWLAMGAGCILGHIFSVYLRFRGGKGVATSLGVILGVWPYFTLTAVVVLAIWVGVWGMWRYVSLASITAAVAFPIAFVALILRLEQWAFADLIVLFVFSCLIAVLVVVRHRSNITRLLAGTENRGQKS